MKKEIQKLLCGAGALTICVMLTGCGHEHTWTEATCTAPKTCSECGKTNGEVLEHTWVEATCAAPRTCSVCGEIKGEALAHTWVEATCAAPKHCSVCGKIEGEVLEHTWIEANYWEAKTCSECGETVGEPMTPSFVEHGVSVMDVTVGAEYNYVMTCQEDKSKETVGTLTITDYQVTDTYEGYETPEGYEWQILKVLVLVGDKNGYNYGAYMSSSDCNYYDADFEDVEWFMDSNTEKAYSINYLGEEYTECLSVYNGKWNDWVDDEITGEGTYAFRVPKGYDGMVVVYGKYNANNLNEFLDEDSLVFRLK